MEFQNELLRLVEGEILVDEPLNRHTSFAIGGPADFFVRPKTEQEMVAVLKLARTHELPLMVIGRGTNLLVEDGGIRGVVLDLSGCCCRLEEWSGGVVVGAGVSLTELLDYCWRREWAGLEFMAGIPGSVGGGIRVNAGAWDRSIGQFVRAVSGYDLSSQAVTLQSPQLHFQYRSAHLPGDLIITEVKLVLSSQPSQVIQNRMEEFRRRRSHQPTGLRSAGCIFKNPPGTAAGKLIEESGCKGMQVNGAQVSAEHANFIVNIGGATAADVKQLIERVRRRVEDQFGVELQMEILVIGEE